MGVSLAFLNRQSRFLQRNHAIHDIETGLPTGVPYTYLISAREITKIFEFALSIAPGVAVQHCVARPAYRSCSLMVAHGALDRVPYRRKLAIDLSDAPGNRDQFFVHLQGRYLDVSGDLEYASSPRSIQRGSVVGVGIAVGAGLPVGAGGGAIDA
ncbi:MAG: hypothetical protein R6X16_03790 [Anaerolineae bacterium]